jgi:hypothetical protein
VSTLPAASQAVCGPGHIVVILPPLKRPRARGGGPRRWAGRAEKMLPTCFDGLVADDQLAGDRRVGAPRPSATALAHAVKGPADHAAPGEQLGDDLGRGRIAGADAAPRRGTADVGDAILRRYRLPRSPASNSAGYRPTYYDSMRMLTSATGRGSRARPAARRRVSAVAAYVDDREVGPVPLDRTINSSAPPTVARRPRRRRRGCGSVLPAQTESSAITMRTAAHRASSAHPAADQAYVYPAR